MNKINKIKLKEEKKDFRVQEALKTLRANVLFSGEDIRTVAVTSTIPGEGKSTVSYQLARSFAEAGKFTLLLDCDIRKSRMMDRFETSGEMEGLSEYLCGMAGYEDIMVKTDQLNLYVILTGRHVPNPAELLSGERFAELLARVRQDFEIVIVDTPPISSVIDGALVASRCDGTVLVVASEMISRKMVQRVKAQLNKSGARILGVALNKVNTTKDSYYYYRYGYDKYGEYAEEDTEPQKTGES